jgi:hypothetical protein
MEIKKKSGLPAQRYKLKSSVFIVIYGVDVENNNVKQFFEKHVYFGVKKS